MPEVPTSEAIRMTFKEVYMDTARELLAEASRTLELLPPEESSDIITRISLFLNEPVQVGETLVCPANYPKGDESWRSDTEVPEGLEVIEHQSTYTNREGEEVDFSYKTYRYPEAGEVRYLEEWDGTFVVTINGTRYKVEIRLSNGSFGEPSDALVTFTRTEEPETDFLSWDEEKAVQDRLASLRAEVENCRQTIANVKADRYDDTVENQDVIRWVERDIEHAERRIERLENGESVLRAPYMVQVFGQPQFIQNEIFPVFQGRSAMHLATIETGWGDAGNVNIMFACDENGVPTRAWFEASCH